MMKNRNIKADRTDLIHPAREAVMTAIVSGYKFRLTRFLIPRSPGSHSTFVHPAGAQ